MTLHDRDRPENGGSGVLVTGPGEVEVARTRSARRWHLGGRTYRVGCGIGPAHYCGDVWSPPGLATPDEWAPIDLRPGLSARSGVRRAMGAAGYTADLGEDLSVTISRGGASVTLLPVALEWRNARGQRQVVATPSSGPVVTDEDGLWCLDAFGLGLDWGLRLWPDMARPVVRIADPAALLTGLSRPLIDPTGLRLCKVLHVGHADGVLPLLTQKRNGRAVGKVRRSGTPDELLTQTAPAALRHSRGDALWFGEARAWDDETGYALTAEWRRYGQAVEVALGMPAETVAAATGALVLDTAISEEQVGAGLDDGYTYDGSYGVGNRRTYEWVYLNYATDDKAIFALSRWTTIPIASGVTIVSASASLQLRDYGNVGCGVSCEAVADSPNLADGNTIIDSRSRTAEAAWSGAYALNWQVTPDLSTQVQSVIGLPGWASGNALSTIFRDTSSGLNAWFWAYEGGAAKAAKFNATYTEAAGASGHPAIMAYRNIPYAFNPYFGSR